MKTLDGIFTEQVSGEPWGAGREGGPGRARLLLPAARCLVSPAVSLCTTLGLSGGRPGWHGGEPHSPEGHRPCPAQPVRSSVGACSCLHLALPQGCGAGGGVRPLRAPALVTETRGACPSHEAGLWFRAAEGAAGLCRPSVSRPAGGPDGRGRSHRHWGSSVGAFLGFPRWFRFDLCADPWPA